MSAREDLYAALMKGGPHSPDRSELASTLLDAYAHELAEKQRKWAVEDDSGASRADGYGSYENVLNAADLIDPEVSS